MTREHRAITRAAGTVGLATFASRLLGFLRDMLLARLFGAGPVSDAFFVAYRIPNMLRELFAEGSMSAAFIPVFTETLAQKGREEARRLASAVFSSLLLAVGLVTLLAMMLAPWIVLLIAPGFSDNPGQFNLTVMLSRFMFPYLVFISLGALAMGMLNSLRSFLAPAFSPVLFNIFIISAALILSPRLTEPIYGVAVGVTAGGLAQLLIQLPGLKRLGMLPSWDWNPFHPGVRRIGWLLLPSMVGLSVTQVNILVNTLLASYLPEGSQTYLFYGMRLVLFPLGVFAVALGTAILPTLSELAAQNRLEELKRTLAFGLRMVSFIILPSMVGLIALRVPIVNLFFEHGAFTPAATAGTAAAVAFYAVGLPAFAGIRIVVAAFYSLKDTKTPAIVAVLAMAVNIVLNLSLMGPMAHSGLALATSLSAVLNMALLVAILHRRLHGVEWRSILRSLAGTAAATVPVGLMGAAISRMPLWGLPGNGWMKAAWLFGGIGTSVLTYALIHWRLGSEEMGFMTDLLKRRFGRPQNRS